MKFSHVYRFMLRNYKFNILWVITILSTLLLLYHVQMDITSSTNNLSDLSDKTEVTASIHIKSKVVDDIPYELIQQLEESNFIKEAYFSTIYKAYSSYPFSNLQLNFDHEKTVVDYYNQEVLLASDYQSVLTSFQPSIETDLLHSLTESNWIIIEETIFKSQELSLGDELIISGEYIPTNYHNMPEEAYTNQSLLGLTFVVVGTYNSSKNIYNSPSYIADNNYILNHYREYIIHEEIPSQYYPFIGHDINAVPHVHTANFTLDNKLELDSFKKLVKESILPTFIYFDFTIDDTLHEAVTRPLIKQIETKKNVLVLIITILIFIQFLISFIASYRKKHVIALLRMSGNKKPTVFLTLFTEHILICFIASSLFVFYLYLYKADFINNVSIPSFRLFYLSYCIGTILSTSILLIKTPMSLLFKKE